MLSMKTASSAKSYQRRRALILLGLYVAMTSVAWPVRRAVGFMAGKPLASHESHEIAATLETPLVGRGNVLWCGVFQLAWNQACEQFSHGIELIPPSPLAVSLNRRAFTRKDIDAASIQVESGRATDVAARIPTNKRVAKLLAPAAQPLLSSPKDLVCYARLDKALDFPQPFGSLGSSPIGGRKVPCFGFFEASSAAMCSQVLIHRYSSPEDFVIELKTKQPDDMLILAKVAPAVTLGDAARLVSATLRASPPSVSAGDLFAAPCIAFSKFTSFSDLENRQVAGAGNTYLTEAVELLEFQMNETGVKLHGESELRFGCSAPPMPEHRLVLKPPFLLLMKRRDSSIPYLACWFANEQLFKRSE